MWRSKKFIIIGVLATVLVAGASIGGVALAQTENGDDSQPTTAVNTLWDKVATILQNEGVNVTSEQLKDAFAQAGKEMRSEALQDYLQNLVKEGKITQEQADEYFKWWQAKPDVPIGFGFGGHGRLPGIGGFRAWGRICIPIE